MRLADLKIGKNSNSRVKKTIKEKANDQSCACNDQISLEEKIRAKAYELYQQRGYQNGHDVEDWLEAKSIVESEAGMCTNRN